MWNISHHPKWPPLKSAPSMSHWLRLKKMTTTPASPPLSPPVQHQGGAGSCPPLASQLTAQQSSYSILLVLTTAPLTLTAPPPPGVPRCPNLQSPYSDPRSVGESPPQRADWRSKINSFFHSGHSSLTDSPASCIWVKTAPLLRAWGGLWYPRNS